MQNKKNDRIQTNFKNLEGTIDKANKKKPAPNNKHLKLSLKSQVLVEFRVKFFHPLRIFQSFFVNFPAFSEIKDLQGIHDPQ
jgi:hypothetical protein